MNQEKKQDLGQLQLFLIFFNLTAILGSVFYYFYYLNWLTITIILVIDIAIGYFLFKNNNFTKSTFNFKLNKLTIFYILFWLTEIILLFNYQTDQAIISPWQVLPIIPCFLIYLIMSSLLIYNFYKANNSSSILISLHFFLSFAVALIIYKIGFGYDPFIHQASEKYIATIGPVLPKTIYYLSQYSLVVILHKLTFIPITLLDKLLIPLTSAILIPVTAFYCLKNNFKKIGLILLLLLSLPYSIFIVTTPQSLAYLNLFLIILFSLKDNLNKNDKIIVSLLAITAIFAQPITGLPALLFSLIIIFKNKFTKYQTTIISLIATINALIVPALFYFTNKNFQLHFKLPWQQWLPALIIKLPNQENIILNLIYFFNDNFKLFLVLAIAIGLYFGFKNNLTKKITTISSLFVVTSVVAYLITSSLNFSFLIDYERQNYAARLLINAVIFSLPLLIILINYFIAKLETTNKFTKIYWLLLTSAVITVSLYLAYPRFDNYFNSHSPATSSADIAVVDYINQDASNQDYIVLANQQTSAASLDQFGFKKYYNNLFYYPIPTGGLLYEKYLAMIKQPNRKIMISAMNATKVNLSYFVLNKYWWASSKIADEAKLEANDWQLINNKIYVFKFEK